MASRYINRFKKRYHKLNGPQKAFVNIGVLGSVVSFVAYVLEPSFLTPDKLFVIAFLVGLVFGQAKQVFYRLGPFVALLLMYESFRGIVPSLNHRVNFSFMPDVDKLLFGGTLPTTTLQNWLWNGDVKWYDYAFYLPYMLHFVLPFVLAVIVWKTREQEYWRYITAFVGISFFAFVVFLLFPAAPPWMASDFHVIDPISRISSHVWYTLGLHDFPSVYDELSPNPVAAVPSLHAAYATLVAMFCTSLFKAKFRYLAWIYPILIYVGTVYQGEHYVFDEAVGAMLGVAGFYASPYISRELAKPIRIVKLAIRRQARLLVVETKRK